MGKICVFEIYSNPQYFIFMTEEIRTIPPPKIIGITVSVDVADREYGKGTSSFLNAQLKWNETDAPGLNQLDDVIVDGLDLYFSVWSTLLASRYAIGIINAEEFNKRLGASAKRLAQVRKYYKKEIAKDSSNV